MAQDKEILKKLMQGENLEDLKKVRDYLRENPLANIMEVNSGTGVSAEQILNFVHLGIFNLKKPRKK